MSETKTTLHAKLAEVVAELGYVAKDGKNEFQNYKYTSAEALLAAVRGPLSAKGIALMPSLTAISDREYTTSKGKASVITTAHVSFTFVDGESGERHECQWAGQGDDPADKGLGKAFTNAIKTFLRESFLIPQGDDPEADPQADARGADRAPRHGAVARVAADAERYNAAKRPTGLIGVTELARIKLKLAEYGKKGLPGERVRLKLAAIGFTEPYEKVTEALPKLSSEQASGLVAWLGEQIEAA